MLARRRIAVIEDDEIMGESLVQRLELEGAETVWWRTAAEALAGLRAIAGTLDAVVCDIRLPDGDGETLFLQAQRSGQPPPFVFITARGEIDQAVRLLRTGGGDYLTKPFEVPALLARLDAIARAPLTGKDSAVLGISSAMRAIEELIQRVAPTNRAILLVGETGVGKEVAARLLHEHSGGMARSSRSTARRFPPTCSRARSSATKGAHSPALMRDTRATPSGRGPARSF